jgi:hypothetical protein
MPRRAAPKEDELLEDDLLFSLDEDEDEVTAVLPLRVKPEPLKTVKVLTPFQVVHDTVAYYPKRSLPCHPPLRRIGYAIGGSKNKLASFGIGWQ